MGKTEIETFELITQGTSVNCFKLSAHISLCLTSEAETQMFKAKNLLSLKKNTVILLLWALFD